RRSAGVYHNTAAIIDANGKLLGKYRKMHVPDDPLYHEKFYFTPGDLGFQAWQTTHGSIGVCVCWDQWYPEAARLTALRGAEIIFYPTAIGWHPSEKKKFGASKYSAWETIQRGHAIANGCYVAAANRVGHEAPAGGDGIEFWGQSFIGGPSGEIVAKGSIDQEEIVMADVEWNRVNEHRTHWPFLRDRRVDAYGGLEQQPYCELTLADACDRMTLRVWSDHPAYKTCSTFTSENFVELSGEFHRHQQYGLEARKWTVRPLAEQEKNELLQGPLELRARQEADWELIAQTIQAILDPRLHALCEAFLKEWGDRFRRTAAARNYHHARRGGLVEHTAQMMRVAKEVAPLYPQLHLDLLLAGILFHDSGKLWENALSENGFVMNYD